MQLTKHAMKRIVERNKQASFMTPKQLISLVSKSDKVIDGPIEYVLIKSIDLVLVLNSFNGNVVTAYCFKDSKFA
jgi:hypothetical protein